jgi:hypothetical protein
LLNSPTDAAVAVAKPKLTLLPLLVVLFLISYGLMAMLVVEQGRTIDTQKYLIRELFSDSTQLTALKGHAAQQQAKAKPRPQAQVQLPATPGNKLDSERSSGKVRRLPLRPPKAASDTPDARRVLMSI